MLLAVVATLALVRLPRKKFTRRTEEASQAGVLRTVSLEGGSILGSPFLLSDSIMTAPIFLSYSSTCSGRSKSRISTSANCLAALFILVLSACGSSHNSLQTLPQKIQYDIVATYPHDTETFTQGLIIKDDVITETSGLYAKSFLVQYHAFSGEIFRREALPGDIFAEGITQFDDQLIMLTWHAGKAFVFDAQTLTHQNTWEYLGEGWGITHNDEHLITSNGSNTLSFRSAEDFSVIKTLQVKDGERSWDQLNELEFSEQYIWANVWRSPLILAINPQTGLVEGTVDLTELDRINNHAPGQSVLNGIAYDPKRDAYWITGKLWPNRYLVRFKWSPPLQ